MQESQRLPDRYFAVLFRGRACGVVIVVRFFSLKRFCRTEGEGGKNLFHEGHEGAQKTPFAMRSVPCGSSSSAVCWRGVAMPTRILIADDDATIRLLLRRLLEEKQPDWQV